MKHCVLLKLAAGADPVQVQEKIWKALRKLDDELDWLNHPVVYRSALPHAGDGAYDIMASFELDGEERLAEYRAHPLTAKLEGRIADAVAERATFDHY